MVWALPFLYLFATLAHAGAPTYCTPVDLRTKPQGKFLSEPRDQDSFGLCYAFTASDLISYRLGRKVSAMHLSFGYNKEIAHSWLSRLGRIFDDEEPVYSGGWVRHAISRFNKYGGCLESAMPSDTRYLNAMSTLTAFHEFKKRWGTRSHAYYLDQQCRDLAGVLQSNELSLFPSLSSRQIAETVLRHRANSLADVLFELSQKGCPPNAKIQLSSSLKTDGGFYISLRNLDNQLSRGNLAAISYYTKRFMNGSKGRHVSSVIGRRWINGRCEYLIRNSWGKGCSGYRDGIECDGESGAFWAGENDLRAAVTEIAYIP